MSETHSRNVLESLSTIARGLNCVSQVLPYHQAVPYPALCSSLLIQHPPGFSVRLSLVSTGMCGLRAAATMAQTPLLSLPYSVSLLRLDFLLVSIRAREYSEESGGYYVRHLLYLKLLHRL